MLHDRVLAAFATDGAANRRIHAAVIRERSSLGVGGQIFDLDAGRLEAGRALAASGAALTMRDRAHYSDTV